MEGDPGKPRGSGPVERDRRRGARTASPHPTKSWPTRAFSYLVAGPLAPVLPIAWVVAAVLAVVYLPSIGAGEVGIGGLTPSDTRALEAEVRSFEAFGSTALTRVTLVQRDPDGVSSAIVGAAVRQAARVLRGEAGDEFPRLVAALPVLNTRVLIPKAAEDRTTVVTYLYFDQYASWERQRRVAAAYGEALGGGGASVVGVTGVVPARLAQTDAIAERLPIIELATVVVIGLIVALTFRSLGAPLITLAAGLLSFVIASHVVAWAGRRAGFAVPPELQPLMVVLLLGIVTDYAIFFLSGCRRALAAGAGRWTAARVTLAQYGPTIVTAGLMVAAGSGVLVVADLDFFRALGPGLALTVLIGLAVAITMVPALLALAGRSTFWPGGVGRPQGTGAAPAEPAPAVTDPGAPGSAADAPDTAARAAGQRSRDRLRHVLTIRPVALVVAAACVAVLVIASWPLRDVTFGFDAINGLPTDAEPRRAADAAASGFSPGIVSPTELLIEGDGLDRRRAELAELERLIAGRAEVTSVLGPRVQSLAEGEAVEAWLGDLPALTVAPSGDAARYLIVFDAHPLGSGGLDLFEALRDDLPGLLRQAGLSGVSASFAGDTAITAETIERTLDDLIRVGLAVIVVDLLLLVVFLRALVAPLYLLVASVLALTASTGLTLFAFRELSGVADLVYYVPFAAAVLLISLGSDYNVFLVGRIWDEAQLRPLPAAIEVATPQATRAISIAAVALSASFALLALVPLTAFRQLALLLSIGVLIDSFLVRSILVPALVSGFGDMSAWPGRLGRVRRSVGRRGLETDGEPRPSPGEREGYEAGGEPRPVA
jgi:RND superfamily putative drug exporter